MQDENNSDSELHFRDMLGLLQKHGVEFLLIGAHALGVHDVPRATGDMDIWIRANPQNGARLWDALLEFGAPLDAFEPTDWDKPGVGMHIGLPPERIDLLTTVSGIGFQKAWENKVTGTCFGLEIHVIGATDLMQSKRASARDKDLQDLKRLETKFGSPPQDHE